MVLLRRFQTPQLYRGGHVSIGNFDGVHIGHREILRRLSADAARDGVPAVVLTFDPHPLALLRPEHVPPALTTVEHRAQLLEQAGATCVIAYPTDQKLLQLTPEEFFDGVIIAELRSRGVVEGPNFCFGKNRKGNIETLRDLCRGRGVMIDVVEPIAGPNGIVSSSAIRSLISAGQLADAVKLLGHAHRISGRVGVGARRGRTIGFPTANLTQIETILPGDGVYSAIAFVEQRPFAAAVNVGPNPTFDENKRKFEAHLIDFSGDLYGRCLDVDLYSRIRDTRRFEGRDDLVRQIAEDVKTARIHLSGLVPQT
jgi:riboflavin kinase / FMN adenylyltransferase